MTAVRVVAALCLVATSADAAPRCVLERGLRTLDDVDVRGR